MRGREMLLTLTAGVLLALIVWRFIGMAPGSAMGWGDAAPRAFAEMVASRDGYTMMTARVGNEEVLYVLDERAERMLVYRAGRDAIDLLASQDLRRLFTDGRASVGLD